MSSQSPSSAPHRGLTIGRLLPPSDFLSLKAAISVLGRVCSVIGVVVDHDSPRRTKGKDWMITFSICDPEHPDPNSAVRVRIFTPDDQGLPSFTFGGRDVILLKSVKVMPFNGEIFLVSNATWGFYWVLAQDVKTPSGNPKLVKCPNSRSGGGTVLKSEVNYIIFLQRWWKSLHPESTASLVQSTQPGANAKPGKRIYSLIRHLEFNKYYEICGEVVKVWDGNPFTVHVTDYSENPHLYNHEWGKYKDTYTRDPSWPGPFGQYTLQVSLWRQNAEAAKEMDVQPGQYIVMCNMRTHANKMHGDFLEGHVDGDRVFLEKVDFRIVTDVDPRVREIQQRKKEYTRVFEAGKHKFQQVLEERIELQEKSQQWGTQDPNVRDNSPEDSNQQEQYHSATSDSDSDSDSSSSSSSSSPRAHRTSRSHSTASPSPLPKSKAKPSTKTSITPTPNPRIKSEYPLNPTTPILEILHPASNHHMNHKYRILCRAIDFLPKDLTKFTKYELPYDKDQDYSQQMTITQANSGRGRKRWQWRFALLVEGIGGGRLQVIVSGREAEYLLGFEAVDLGEDRKALGVLKKKMGVMWGNLGDVKGVSRQTTPPLQELARLDENKAETAAERRKRKRRAKNQAKKKRKNGDGQAVEVGCDGEERGEIEEKKEEKLKGNDWFECTIASFGEYDEEKKEWKRRWKLWGTTIH